MSGILHRYTNIFLVASNWLKISEENKGSGAKYGTRPFAYVLVCLRFICRKPVLSDLDHRACKGFLELVVVAKTDFDAGFLEVVAAGNLLLDERNDLVFL